MKAKFILTVYENHVHLQVEGNAFLLMPGPDPENPADAAEIAQEVECPDMTIAAKILNQEDIWPHLEYMQ